MFLLAETPWLLVNGNNVLLEFTRRLLAYALLSVNWSLKSGKPQANIAEPPLPLSLSLHSISLNGNPAIHQTVLE
jgi:hypothetical protein